jgi:hypothetical protein
MRLKTFRLFENDMPEDMVRMQDGGMYDKKTVYPELGPDTYYADDFLAFSGAVKAWMDKTGQKVMWSLIPFGYSDSENPTNNLKAKSLWDMYVKGEREMTLIEMEDKLVAVLHEGGNIIMAMDNMDKPVDLDMVKGKI